MKEIYSYSDFREFLKDYYQQQKSETPDFSFQKFSRLAGLGSPNYLKLVMEGSRSLTIANIHQFAQGLGLNYEETHFFESLVLFNQAKLPNERSYYLSRISELKRLQPKQQAKKLTANELLSSYYYPALLVCLDRLPVTEAYDTVERKIGIPRQKSEPVISILKKNGVLLEAEGRYHLSDNYYVFHDQKIKSALQKKYTRSQLKLSSDVFEKRYEKNAKFFCHTFTIAEGTLRFYADRISTFLAELTEHSNQESPDEVAQLNIQLFPYEGR